MVLPYVNDLLQIKALVQQMPKFGKEIDLVIEGLARILLTASGSMQTEAIREMVFRS